jgi:hypothetical protein
MDEIYVREVLKARLTAILRDHPGTVLLSALATGADTWAVQVAQELQIPWIVVLPLPYELYADDFSAFAQGNAALRAGTKSWDKIFRELVAGAEYYFELPLTAGRCSEMSRHRTVPMTEAARRLRAEQYAAAGRYIVERSDRLLAVWDDEPARGAGGTADMVARRCELARADRPQAISTFFPPPAMTEPENLPCHPPPPASPSRGSVQP